MSIFGGGSTSQKETRYIGIPVQTSIKGSTIPRAWGTVKAGCNLLDYLDFNAKAQSNSQGGKGGPTKSVTYSYSATVLLGLMQGPIAGIRKVFKDQAIYTNGATTALAQAGLSLATGAIGQAPWGYLVSAHPDHALGYSNLAYLYAQNYTLNSGATLQNHSFEVQTVTRQVVGGVALDDANPKDIILDFFSTLPQWPGSSIGDLTDYALYCQAANLLLSPLLDTQRQVSDFLSEILTASNSDCVWSDGVLKFIPYGDTVVSANGATWTPYLTPKYDLQWSHFLAGDGEDPIKWDFKRPSDAYNLCQVEYLDRNANYVTDVQPAIDQANVDQYGLRKQDPTSLHSICDPSVAATIAQILVQRTCNVRRTATFELPEVFGLLDPMDTLTVPLRNGGRRFVRIVDYDEKPDACSIIYHVEEMLVGVGHAAEYARQSANGAVQNFNIDPGDTGEPAIFDVPVQLAQVVGLETWIAATSVSGNPYWGGCEVWLATESGGEYVKKATIIGGSRMGTLTATFPSGSDPDTVNTLAIDLSISQGVLEPGTLDDANSGTTLCFVDGEYIAYEQATLTAPYQYDLGKSGATPGLLRRGFWGSAIASHPSGSLFVRLDDSVLKIPFNATDVGRTIYVKLLSFNVYLQALQSLADVVEYSHVIDGPPTIYAPETLTVTQAIKGLQLNWINAPNVGIAAVEIWRSASSSFGGAAQLDDAGSYATSYNDQSPASNTQYWYWIRCRDIAGNEGEWEPSTSGAGATNTAGQAQTPDIATAAVVTDSVAADNITVPNSILGSSTTIAQTPTRSLVATLVLSNNGGVQKIRFNDVFNRSGGHSPTITMTLERNGTPISQTQTGGSGIAFLMPGLLNCEDSPGVGTFTYDLYEDASGDPNCLSTQPYLDSTELLR